MKYARRDNRDANHANIVQTLRRYGLEVVETERPLDILIWNGGRAGWGEIKQESRNASVQRGQLEFMAGTNMPVAFIRTPDEALEFAATMNGLTQRQKQAIAIFLRSDGRKSYYPATVEAILSGEKVVLDDKGKLVRQEKVSENARTSINIGQRTGK